MEANYEELVKMVGRLNGRDEDIFLSAMHLCGVAGEGTDGYRIAHANMLRRLTLEEKIEAGN